MSNLSDLYPSGGSEEVAQTLLDHFVLLNGDAEALQVLLANDVTPASFATWISGSGKEAKFTQLISAPNGAAAVVASSTALNAVVASSIAMNAVAASSTAMTAVVASSIAMNAVAASNTAMTAVAASDTASDAVFTSSTAKLAVWNSNTALSAYQANPTQVQRQITERGVTSSATSVFTFVSVSTKVILLRAFVNSAAANMPLAWRSTSTTPTPTVNSTDGILLPNGDSLGTDIIPPKGRTTTYADSGSAPTANNTNSNVVSAANGLRIIAQNAGYNKTVIYITV
jgi:hypothetical protein